MLAVPPLTVVPETPVIDRKSPSGSKSLSRTKMSIAVSTVPVIKSSTATGGWFVAVPPTVTVTVADAVKPKLSAIV